MQNDEPAQICMASSDELPAVVRSPPIPRKRDEPHSGGRVALNQQNSENIKLKLYSSK
jgi:hypothetical protein